MTPQVLAPDDVVAAATTVATNDEVIACVELLVHTDDALSGLGVALEPPVDLCRRVLAQQYPDVTTPGGSWQSLLAATGRPVRPATH